MVGFVECGPSRQPASNIDDILSRRFGACAFRRSRRGGAVRAGSTFLTNGRAYAENTLEAYERDIWQFFCLLNGAFRAIRRGSAICTV